MPKLPPPPRSPHSSSGSVAGVDAQAFAVGGDQVGGPQVVDGQPVPAHQMPEPAAERHPADPGGADRAAGGGQAVPLGGEVQLGPGQAAGGPRGPCRGVDRHRLELRQVDHDAAVADAVPHHGVAAAADRDRQVALAGEPDRLLDVVGAGAAGDQRGLPVDRAVPDPAGLGVALLARSQQRAAEAVAQFVQQDGGSWCRSCEQGAPAGVPRAFLGGGPQRSVSSAACAAVSQTRTPSASSRRARLAALVGAGRPPARQPAGCAAASRAGPGRCRGRDRPARRRCRAMPGCTAPSSTSR